MTNITCVCLISLNYLFLFVSAKSSVHLVDHVSLCLNKLDLFLAKITFVMVAVCKKVILSNCLLSYRQLILSEYLVPLLIIPQMIDRSAWHLIAIMKWELNDLRTRQAMNPPLLGPLRANLPVGVFLVMSQFANGQLILLSPPESNKTT